MSFDPVGIDLTANNASQFTRDINASEFALRQQAKAFETAAKALQEEIRALKDANEPNRALIRSKQELLNQTRENAAQTREAIKSIRDEGSAYSDANKAVSEHKSFLGSLVGTLGAVASTTLKVIGTVSTLVTGYELLKKAGESIPAAGKAFDSLNAAASKTKGFITNLVSSFTGAGNGLKGLAPAAGVAVGAFAAISAAAIAAGLAITAATVGINLIVGAIGKFASLLPEAISAGREFEKAMRTVSTAMSGTEEDVKKLGHAILNLSTTLNIPAVELAAAQYEILSAGISDTGTAFETLNQAGQLAKAGLGTVEESANLLTSAINAFGVGPKQAAEVLFKTIQDGKTTAAGLSQSFGLVAGSAQSAGVSFNELNAATAALTLTGQTASTAQNNLRQAIANITQPSEDAKKVAKTLGIEFNGAALQTKGLTGFLNDLKAKVGENKTALGQLFGSVEAYNAIVKLTGVSQADYIRILGDLKNSQGGLYEAFQKQRDIIGEIANAIQNNLIKAGQAILTQFNPVLRQLAALYTDVGSQGQKFAASLVELVGEIARTVAGFAKLLLGISSASHGLDIATFAAKGLTTALDIINTTGEATAHVLASIAQAGLKLAQVDFAGAFAAVKDVPSYLGSKYNQFKDRLSGRFGPGDQNIQPAAGQVQPKPNSDPSKSKAIDTKKQAADSQEKIDRQHIQDIEREFQHQLQQARDAAELSIKQLGPFADPEDVLKKKIEEEQKAASILNAELIALNGTQTKTADGKRALSEAINKTKDDIAKEKGALQDAYNAYQKFNADTAEQDQNRNFELQLARIQQQTDLFVKGQQEQQDSETTRYQQGKITIDAYYDGILEHIENKARAEEEAYEKANALIEQQIELLKTVKGYDDNRPEIKDLKAQQSKLYLGSIVTDSNYAAERDAANKQRQNDLSESSRNFAQDLQNDISQALQNAFSGQGPLAVIKSFGKSLFQTVVQSISTAIAQGFAKSQIFQDLTNSVGDFLNKLSGKSSVQAANAPGGTGGGGGIGNALKSFFAGGKTTLKPVLGDISGGQGIPFINATGGKGIPFVAQGASSSSLLSTVSAAALPIGIALSSAQNAIAKGGSLGDKYVNFIDPLNFRGLFGLGSSKAKKQAARDAYHQNVLAPYLNNIVATANPDNLDDLNASFRLAANGKKSNGSDGQKLKQQAMQQILDLITKRQQAIADFIKSTKQQNEDLADNIALNDSGPLEKAALARQIAIKQIQRDTATLLEQYKDSEAAKTEILAQETLKRQQLDQQEKDQFKSDTQDFLDLLKQRDDASNANVYTRAQTPEQQKADQLAKLDQEIAQKALELKGQLAAGTTADSLGSNQAIQGLNNLTQTNNLQVIVNAANDPNAVTEQVTRALAAFTQKYFGAMA